MKRGLALCLLGEQRNVDWIALETLALYAELSGLSASKNLNTTCFVDVIQFFAPTLLFFILLHPKLYNTLGSYPSVLFSEVLYAVPIVAVLHTIQNSVLSDAILLCYCRSTYRISESTNQAMPSGENFKPSLHKAVNL